MVVAMVDCQFFLLPIPLCVVGGRPDATGCFGKQLVVLSNNMEQRGGWWLTWAVFGLPRSLATSQRIPTSMVVDFLDGCISMSLNELFVGGCG